MDLTTDNDMLPELTYEISLSPNSEDTYSLDGSSQFENTLPICLLPGPNLDQDKVQMLDDDALFSVFLRSLSLSLSYTDLEYSKDGPETSIPPQTIVPADICLSTERDPYLADLAAEDVLDFKHKNVQTKKKPCMTLQVRPIKAASKPKVSLRLNPPKKAPKKASKKAPMKAPKQAPKQARAVISPSRLQET